MNSSINVIGRPRGIEFHRFLRQLEEFVPRTALTRYPNAAAWQTAPETDRRRPTLVLQSWSDEYSPDEVSLLISTTQSFGLLCCCGQWCAGDGRTRSVWPPALRVSLPWATEAVRQLLQDRQAGCGLLPATAARDEVFLYRSSESLPSSVPRKSASVSVRILSPDRVYRRTLCDVLKHFGCRTSEAVLSEASLNEIADVTHVLLHLVPWTAGAADLVRAARNRFGPDRVIVLTTMPPATHPELPDIEILPALDPVSTVRRIMDA